MKIGIIDIGTNSVRLFVPEENNIAESQKFLRITRLGENVNRNHYLLDEAMDRTVQGLRELQAVAAEKGANRLYAMATSAVRDSSNKDLFVKRVWDELGIEVQVLPGKEEADLGFTGTVKGLAHPKENYLIIDIGGGSTELIDAMNGTIRKSHSFDIGVVRLTEMFELSDPPEQSELSKMGEYIEELLKSYLEDCNGVLVGIGGTITTLSAIISKLDEYDRKKVHGSVITKDEIEQIYQELIRMTNAQRKSVIGLDEKRADVIVSGIVILLSIMHLTMRDTVIVSDYDNLEGFYFKKILLTK